MTAKDKLYEIYELIKKGKELNKAIKEVLEGHKNEDK
ncbi:MAG: hypothetical protein JG776_474 [Caloramator sp.]|jgi:hypothetical protein|nr:hypothetical protein [Caloramator sp.]